MSVHIKSRLKILLAERDMNQKDLAEGAGLTTRLISEIANNKTKQYPKEALEKIVEFLKLDNMSDLFSITNDKADD